MLGALDDEKAFGSNHLVRPYVGVLTSGVSPRITAEHEVAELIHVPVGHLLDERSHTWKVVEQAGGPEAQPAFEFEGHVIWGLTARILTGFLSVIGEPAR